MECKYYYTSFLRNCQWELIDTLWNVNLIMLKREIEQQELIDTLWNVNRIGFEKLSAEMPELIDTLWNVNMYPFGIFILNSLN